MHATFSCRSYWQLSYGSLKLTSRNTIITPKGLWVLVRCFLRSFHSYAKNPSATCPQLFFSTQGKKKTFSSHSTKNDACLEDKLMIIWVTIWNQLIHTPQGKLCLLFSLKSFYVRCVKIFKQWKDAEIFNVIDWVFTAFYDILTLFRVRQTTERSHNSSFI